MAMGKPHPSRANHNRSSQRCVTSNGEKQSWFTFDHRCRTAIRKAKFGTFCHLLDPHLSSTNACAYMSPPLAANVAYIIPASMAWGLLSIRAVETFNQGLKCVAFGLKPCCLPSMHYEPRRTVVERVRPFPVLHLWIKVVPRSPWSFCNYIGTI